MVVGGASSKDEQLRFLRQSCEAHPMADYSSGVRELFKKLPQCQIRLFEASSRQTRRVSDRLG
jgi:hypothetical protein